MGSWGGLEKNEPWFYTGTTKRGALEREPMKVETFVGPVALAEEEVV